MAARVDPSKSDKKFGELWSSPVTPELCKRICTWQAKRWALPRISST